MWNEESTRGQGTRDKEAYVVVHPTSECISTGRLSDLQFTHGHTDKQTNFLKSVWGRERSVGMSEE